MRRLIVLLLLATTVGVAVYRHRQLDRHEQELAIGRYRSGGTD